ncbi:UNVERIFIED_CONTAM: hypothetical protein GTU68_007224 [Idotea baltica]|nr:hypothetical protein [Idotea baltica]
MKRSARITIHPESLQHNLNRAKHLAPNSNLLAVIKANAYGHNSVDTAGILYEIAQGFAVACIPEAVVLRDAAIDKPLTILQGFQNDRDLRIAEQLDLRLTVHDDNQLRLLENHSAKSAYRFKLNIKVDSGMHRLGFQPERAESIYNNLSKLSQIDPDQLIMMTHFSSADDLDNECTSNQIAVFNKACANIKAPQSIANSAGILGWQASHSDWIRPGILLYGSSPFANKTRDELDLKSAMTFEAPVISVHDLKKGDCIGYAQSWTCDKDMRVAVIGCGYADGYPRHAPSNTPVWLNGEETKLLGRVSMDMIVVDVDERNHDNYKINPVKVGDIAELWGKNVSADRVATAAETIAYEILCNAGNIRS